MRDIICRGKKTNNGEWVEGYYVYMKDRDRGIAEHRIYTGSAEVYDRLYGSHKTFPEYFEVDPDTLGSYSGKTDMYDKEIFEGNILEGEDYNSKDGYGVVYWDEKDACFKIKQNFGASTPILADLDQYYSYKLTVIGNIYDNGYLIGG